ncbi:galactoside O-acetyltransferase [Clostridium chromiireducens]|uniref:Galactoside O-acetyltransferase n=2 Tax=Clostridium chromiireducens TaxID=225345 RepID=A0A1V4IX35_9CLOT|nr:galactoside O-acetyltransferase [Clostridium chromiireducens]
MINEMNKNWTDFVDINKLRETINKRKIYIWGAYEQGKYIYDFLIKNKFSVSAFIDSKKCGNCFGDLQVYEPKILKQGGGRDKFVIIPLTRREEILSFLNENGYEENSDYIYIDYDVTIISVSGYYSDYNGNVIISNGRIDCVNIKFTGYNNKVFIGSKFRVDGSIQIELKYGSTIKFGSNFRCCNDYIYIENGAVYLGDNCSVGHDSYICSRETLVIGNSFTVTSNLYLVCEKNAPINIGNDCMLSDGIRIRSDNGHSIFDMIEEKNLSLCNEQYVKIGNHVWIGMATTILFNSDIGEGSVIGANSLVKGEFPPNCIIAGNAAKVIRENIKWDRRNNLKFNEFIGNL